MPDDNYDGNYGDDAYGGYSPAGDNPDAGGAIDWNAISQLMGMLGMPTSSGTGDIVPDPMGMLGGGSQNSDPFTLSSTSQAPITNWDAMHNLMNLVGNPQAAGPAPDTGGMVDWGQMQSLMDLLGNQSGIGPPADASGMIDWSQMGGLPGLPTAANAPGGKSIGQTIKDMLAKAASGGSGGGSSGAGPLGQILKALGATGNAFKQPQMNGDQRGWFDMMKQMMQERYGAQTGLLNSASGFMNQQGNNQQSLFGTLNKMIQDYSGRQTAGADSLQPFIDQYMKQGSPLLPMLQSQTWGNIAQQGNNAMGQANGALAAKGFGYAPSGLQAGVMGDIARGQSSTASQAWLTNLLDNENKKFQAANLQKGVMDSFNPSAISSVASSTSNPAPWANLAESTSQPSQFTQGGTSTVNGTPYGSNWASQLANFIGSLGAT